jgi:SAM-dependent methyltransferase
MYSERIKEVQQLLWAPSVDQYERLLDPVFEPVLETLLARANVWPGESALDVGSATGSMAIALAGRVGEAGEVFALDLTQEMVEATQRRAAALGLPNLQADIGDAEALPFSGPTFDVIVSALTYMVCPEPRRAFAEAFRVLRTPGRLILAVWGRPDRCAFRSVLPTVNSLLPDPLDLPSPFTLADVDDLWDALQQAGFRPAVEALEMEFHYPDAQAFLDVHAPAARLVLTPEEYQQALETISARVAPRGGPLRLINEVVFGLGYR